MRPTPALHALAAVTALALPAGALASICPTPQLYLVICCPKPCPVVDYAQNALKSAKVVVDRARVAMTAEQTRTTRDTESSLGLEGRRSSTAALECPNDESDIVIPTTATTTAEVTYRGDPVTLAAAGFIRSDGDDPHDRQGRRMILERVRHRTIADAVLAGETLAGWADTASESAAKASDAVQRARDARSLMRRNTELRMAINRLDAITRIAEAIGTSVKASVNLKSRVRGRF